jgi:hypothetical protein
MQSNKRLCHNLGNDDGGEGTFRLTLKSVDRILEVWLHGGEENTYYL